MEKIRLHPIRSVAHRTGLSSHVIRAWEKRYAAIEPSRTGTNRRLYTDADIERLQLLKLATEGGRGIGHIANLPMEELRMLVTQDGASYLSGSGQSDTQREPADYHLEKCLAAVNQFDAGLLEERLLQASVTLPAQSLIDDLLTPFMAQLGEMWHRGAIRPAHEHLAAAVVRTVLGNLAASHQAPSGAPEIVVTTPAGQWHEFGALAVAATAATEGWRVSYLGPNLPAEDIAAVTRSRKARAVAISLTYPADDAHLHAELLRLGKLLPESVAVLAGGKASGAYTAALREIGAISLPNLAELRSRLQALRAPGGADRVRTKAMG